MSLLIAKFIKNSYIYATSYFIFLKNVLKTILNAFNTNFDFGKIIIKADIK